ncbi:MAG: DUF262 domain-containing protein [Hyphomicrobiaceae bacterium]
MTAVTPRLTSNDLSIEELLSGQYRFSIPAYQRDFSWTRIEANQLIDDISTALDDAERTGSGIPYFLGTMLFVAVGRASDASRLVDVVDGQQRLITLTIMFAVLRDIEHDDSAAEIDELIACTDVGRRHPHLALRAADHEFFSTAILNPGVSQRARPATELAISIARQNVEDVRRTLRLRIKDQFDDATERARFLQFARRQLRVLVVTSNDFDYAYQIFLTINDRGKRLSVEDIFRGEILGPLDPDQRERYSAIVDQMDKYNSEQDRARSKNKTFFSHLANIDGWPRMGIIQGLKRTVQERGGPRKFVTEVFAPMAEAYLQVKGADIASPVPQQAADYLQVLRWLEQHGDDDWVPLAMVALDRIGADVPTLTAFLRTLDRYAHGLMALGCGRDARRRHYTPVLKRLLSDEPFPDPSRILTFGASDQRQILRNIATRLHATDPPTARLFLFRADMAISGRQPAYYAPLIDPSRPAQDRFTVEHVVPKGQVADGEWTRYFPRSTARLRASQCIGNLVLITEAQNKKASQREFLSKKGILFPDGAASPLYLTDVLRAEERWDAVAIARRYDLIMTALRTLWSLEGAIPPCPALAGRQKADETFTA